MEHTELWNGVAMPLIGQGTFVLTPDEAEGMVLAALRAGVRLIDTANAYMNEKAVGRAIRASGVPREEIFLTTKLWPSFYEQPDAVERTMARLGDDCLDLILLHHPTENWLTGYRQLEAAVAYGRARAIGVCNFDRRQTEELLRRCRVRPAVVQAETHIYNQNRELERFLRSEGIVLEPTYPLGDVDRGPWEEPLLRRLGEKYGKTPAQVTLRWHLQLGRPLIPVARDAAQLREFTDIRNLSLTDGEMEEIRALDRGRACFTASEQRLRNYAAFVPPLGEQK